MLEILLPILCTALLGYLTFILVRAYRPDWFRSVSSSPGSAHVAVGSQHGSGSVAVGSHHGSAHVAVSSHHGSGSVVTDGSKPIEPFAQKAMGPPTASEINMPSQPTPSAAPPTRGYELAQEPRTVAPGGPGAPNAQDQNRLPTISPEVMPIDPFNDFNMEAPIKDSMRHPELSFGPGMDNSGIKKATASGVMHKGALSSESPFSPEFAQNGGQFMGTVTANDLSHDDTYATA